MKTLTFLVHAEFFWCFHNPPNSGMDYRIVNFHICDLFAHVYTKKTLVYSLIQTTFVESA